MHKSATEAANLKKFPAVEIASVLTVARCVVCFLCRIHGNGNNNRNLSVCSDTEGWQKWANGAAELGDKVMMMCADTASHALTSNVVDTQRSVWVYEGEMEGQEKVSPSQCVRGEQPYLPF